MKEEKNQNNDEVIESVILENLEDNIKEKIKKLKEDLKACEKEKNEYLTGWQKERADFINYKKEERKRIIEAIELTKMDMLAEFLGVLDTFSLAEASPEWKNLPASWQAGIKGIYNQLWAIFKESGVTEIELYGKIFDPNLAEAVSFRETDKEEEDGKISKVINKGFKLNGRVLRVAKVEVLKYKKHE